MCVCVCVCVCVSDVCALLPATVQDMTEKFKDGKKLHRKYLIELMIRAKEILSARPSLVDLAVEEVRPTSTWSLATHFLVQI